MGFSSVDNLLDEVTVNGNTNEFWFNKVSSNGATSAAGRFHEFFTATGMPGAGSWSGSAGAGAALSSSTTGAIPLIEGDVSTATRHLLNMAAYTTASAVAPANLYLVDLLSYIPACVVTGTPTTLTPASLTRYTGGIGVRAFVAVQSALGAASPVLTLTYTAVDSAGSTSSQSATLTSPANSAPISTLFQNSGNPFLPLAAGKVGLTKVDSYTLSSGTTGTVAIVLCKPIAQIPIVATYLLSERDFVSQLPSLPRIYDDACLGLVLGLGGSMVTLSHIGGKLQYGWGG